MTPPEGNIAPGSGVCEVIYLSVRRIEESTRRTDSRTPSISHSLRLWCGVMVVWGVEAGERV